MNRAFLDSNLAVYFFTSTEPEKRRFAGEIRLASEGIISTQVLSELSNVLSRKFQFDWNYVRSAIRQMQEMFTVRTIGTSTIATAISLAERYGYRYYDCQILASAMEANCTTLYSEDMQHRQIIQGITIINPFQ